MDKYMIVLRENEDKIVARADNIYEALDKLDRLFSDDIYAGRLGPYSEYESRYVLYMCSFITKR